MIKSIMPSGRYTQTTGGTLMTPYISPGAQGAGQVRYNTTSSNMEVWDGMSWKEISNNYVSIGLTNEAESLLDWARIKRDEDMQLKELLKKSPALKDIHEKFEVVLALVKSEINN